MEIDQLLHQLRNRLTEYRYAKKNLEISKHINAIDIAVSLVQYAIEDNRPINLDEENWFNASFHLSYLLDGSDWQDLSNLYGRLSTEVKLRNYFR